MRRGRVVFYLLLVLIALATGYGWFASSRFESTIDTLRERVLSADAPAAPVELPEIVRAFALRNGGTIGGPRAVHLRHRATLATAKDAPPIALETDQWLSTRTSELVWRGRGTMMGLPVTVVDSIVGGEGLLEARLLGAITLAHGTGPDFDKGELHRFISELPVHPDAILNNANLRWRVVDASTVEVTARSQYGEASATFSFDDAGDIVGMEAPDRPMTVGNKTVPTVWRGMFGRYKTIGTHRIPTYGEVGWVLPDGIFIYWKGEVVAYEPL